MATQRSHSRHPGQGVWQGLSVPGLGFYDLVKAHPCTTARSFFYWGYWGQGVWSAVTSLMIWSLETLPQVVSLCRPGSGQVSRSLSLCLEQLSLRSQRTRYTCIHKHQTFTYLKHILSPPNPNKYTQYHPHTNAYTQYNPHAYKLTQKHNAAPYTQISPPSSTPSPWLYWRKGSFQEKTETFGLKKSQESILFRLG